MAVQDFAAPVSLDEALPAFAGGDQPAWLAGGTDLLVGMRLGAKNPDRIVDLKRIPELMAIVEDESSLRLGAAVASYDLVRHPAVASLYPGLAEALDLIGSTQIQGRCSAGGNLCNASPAADSIPALIANNASCRIIGPGGERLLPVEQFVTGPGSTALTSGELLVELILPRPPERGSDAYLRLTPRTEMDIAVAGAGVALALDEEGRCCSARIAVGAVAATPLLVEEAGRALQGSRLEQDAIDAVVAAVRAAASPISDKRASADYRRHVVGVLVARAIRAAHERIVRGEAS